MGVPCLCRTTDTEEYAGLLRTEAMACQESACIARRFCLLVAKTARSPAEADESLFCLTLKEDSQRRRQRCSMARKLPVG